MGGQDLGALAQELFSKLSITPAKRQQRLEGVAGGVKIVYTPRESTETFGAETLGITPSGRNGWPSECVTLSVMPLSDGFGLWFGYIASKPVQPLSPVEPRAAPDDNLRIFLSALIEGIAKQAGTPGDIIVYQQQIPPSCMRSVAEYFIDRFNRGEQKPSAV